MITICYKSKPKIDYYESIKNHDLSVDGGSSGLFSFQAWPELRLVRTKMRGKEKNVGDLDRWFFGGFWSDGEREATSEVASWEKRGREEEDGEGKVGVPWCRVLVWCGDWIFAGEEDF
ncbi:hypothetical protein HAX54_018121 [Datura stramonium]|uniref:Uncharacterized protein n=1 Tax=Datura stramonium TaxID=4076 RepID=A0ABS8Y3K7_DATST|nr:hypothetical protein [Datura stramonium]